MDYCPSVEAHKEKEAASISHAIWTSVCGWRACPNTSPLPLSTATPVSSQLLSTPRTTASSHGAPSLALARKNLLHRERLHSLGGAVSAMVLRETLRNVLFLRLKFRPMVVNPQASSLRLQRLHSIAYIQRGVCSLIGVVGAHYLERRSRKWV